MSTPDLYGADALIYVVGMLTVFYWLVRALVKVVERLTEPRKGGRKS